MKVTLKNNRFMHRLVTAGIFAILFTFILSFNYPQAEMLLFFIAVIPVVAVWYLISILQFINQDIAIQSPFSMYLATGILAVILPFLPAKITGPYYFPFGAINLVLLIYMVLKAFQIKNRQFAPLFKLYTIALSVILLLKFITIFLFIHFSIWLYLADLVPLFIVTRIINRTGKMLQTETAQIVP
jgi:hypothetical protein